MFGSFNVLKRTLRILRFFLFATIKNQGKKIFYILFRVGLCWNMFFSFSDWYIKLTLNIYLLRIPQKSHSWFCWKMLFRLYSLALFYKVSIKYFPWWCCKNWIRINKHTLWRNVFKCSIILQNFLYCSIYSLRSTHRVLEKPLT